MYWMGQSQRTVAMFVGSKLPGSGARNGTGTVPDPERVVRPQHLPSRLHPRYTPGSYATGTVPPNASPNYFLILRTDIIELGLSQSKPFTNKQPGIKIAPRHPWLIYGQRVLALQLTLPHHYMCIACRFGNRHNLR